MSEKNIPELNTENWYVLRVMPKQEFKSCKFLKAKGIEHYLPVIKKKRKWSDRIKFIDFPVFSGYIFVKLEYATRYMDVLNFQGHLGFIKTEGQPDTISEKQLSDLKIILEKGQELRNDPIKNFTMGKKVAIIFGPFKGVKGIISKIKNQHRITIDIEMLGRSVSSKIDPAYLPKGRISTLQIDPADLEVVVE